MGPPVAARGDLGGAEARVIVLASTSPQRSAILTQLGIPFEAVAPPYEEAPGGDPLEHAAGKARSVDGGATSGDARSQIQEILDARENALKHRS